MKQSNKVLLAILMMGIIFSFGYNKSISQVTDIDGNVYKTVKTGNQEWMAENLSVSHYRNGDVIPQVQDADEWLNLSTGSWCYYDKDPENGKTYGKLYNWYALNDLRGLSSKGWQVPSKIEWRRPKTIGKHKVKRNESAKKYNDINITSDNLSVLKEMKNKYSTCYDIVEEILITSPVFIKLTDGLFERVKKNGGIGYGFALEGSPSPEIDDAWNYSPTYDFNLHESYKERIFVFSRFTFSPKDKQLYQLDATNDELVPIEFNRNLLIKFDEFCK